MSREVRRTLYVEVVIVETHVVPGNPDVDVQGLWTRAAIERAIHRGIKNNLHSAKSVKIIMDTKVEM